MLNSYTLEKRLKEYQKVNRKKSMEQTWHNWKEKNSPKWVDNYRRRIEKFVVDVDENVEDYERLFTSHKKSYSNHVTGSNHFIFRPFKTEKERVKETLELNKYSTEPINQPVLHHRFRERNKSKEIQPDMKFSPRYKPLSPPASSTRTSSINYREDLGLPKHKVHLKSTYSMLLRVGVLNKPSDLPLENEMQLYTVLSEENSKDHATSQESSVPSSLRKGKSGKLGLDYKDPLKLAKQLLLKAMSTRGGYYMPKLSKPSDPILNAAEKLLLKSDTIRRKKNVKYEDNVRRGAVMLPRVLK